jgi:hypothetical protein
VKVAEILEVILFQKKFCHCYQNSGKARSSVSKECRLDYIVIVMKTSLAGPHKPQSLQTSVNLRSIVEILKDGWLTIDGNKGKIRGVNIELDL